MEYVEEKRVVDDIKSVFKDVECRVKRERRVEVKLPREKLLEFALRMQTNWDFPHLSAISCVDWIDDGEFELTYHFWSYNRKVLVSASIRIPREEDAHFETLTHLWQPAKFFERDIHEMFGITFDGNDDMERFILGEWDGPPPMRKDFITREYALSFYHFREYHPEWMKDLEGQEKK